MPSLTGVQTCALRSEEHTSELQSLTNIVCRLLLEKKTPYGTLPSEEDIDSTLKSGLITTAMLSRLQLSDDQIHQSVFFFFFLMPNAQKAVPPLDLANAPR